jgi:hypothetical protein
MVQREELQRLLRQRPFQPFRIHLTDGRTYDIRFPEINLLGQTYLEVGIPVPNDPDPVYDYTVTVLLSWMTHVELLPVSSPTVS